MASGQATFAEMTAAFGDETCPAISMLTYLVRVF